ncbi:hypothetical protein DL95DRAFT_371117 [Leptodontidium sp. 2 PMI_412]|nr:hypothetical protein DL95DRAFT_371117 [Leptodontidium sp. 2 PMI_412]
MKSIRTFVQPSQNPRATDVALMVCVLFVCFEILRGHHGSAIAHIESGAKILLEATAKEDSQQYPDSTFRNSSIPYAPLSSLTLIFVRLDLQASQILSKRPLYLRQESTDKESGFHSDIPPSFSSLEESRNAMDYLRNCVMRSLEPITQANTEVFVQPTQNLSNTNRKICAQNVKRWSMAFEAFLRSQSHELDLIAQQGVHMLKIHRIMLGMNLDIEDLDVQWTETAWDSYMPEFEAIISHAASILSFPVQGRKFSLEPGLVPALYFVATKCRHGVIRRKAIAFVSAARRQEGVWDSAPVAVVLERYVELEEAGLGEVRDADDVPDSQRLSGIDARFDLEGRRAVVYYQRIWGPDNITKLDIEECIEW